MHKIFRNTQKVTIIFLVCVFVSLRFFEWVFSTDDGMSVFTSVIAIFGISKDNIESTINTLWEKNFKLHESYVHKLNFLKFISVLLVLSVNIAKPLRCQIIIHFNNNNFLALPLTVVVFLALFMLSAIILKSLKDKAQISNSDDLFEFINDSNKIKKFLNLKKYLKS